MICGLLMKKNLYFLFGALINRYFYVSLHERNNLAMKLKFTIHYNTAWGQTLHVALTSFTSDGRKRCNDLLMNTVDGCWWTLETAVMENRQHPVISISYHYQVEEGEQSVLRQEWNLIPRLYSVDGAREYIFNDEWRDTPLQYHLYSNAHATATKHERDEKTVLTPISLFRRTIVFRVSAPQLADGESIGVCGNHPSLGDWNPSRYLKMVSMGNHEWILSVNIYGMNLPLEYKYVIIDDKTNQLKCWEDGSNRSTGEIVVEDGQVLVMYGNSLHVREKTWRCAGVSVPVFSLRSEHSFGVGDFGDIQRLTDWAVKTGMKVIQILPVNDTSSTHSWTDSHPYNCISAFALHPHYLDLEQLGEVEDEKKRTAYNRQRRELNALNYSDYLAVDRVKNAYVEDMFQKEGNDVLESSEFNTFFTANREWLIPYAAFCVLRDRYHTSRFTDWKEHSAYHADEIEAFCADEPQVKTIYYVQYNLYLQLKRATKYARKNGVILKGDLPTGIYQDSVETWTHPEYFNLKAQTGAPPDRESLTGQNWGFPTYNWLAFENDNYVWWHKRMAYLEQFFDALRVDHIVGYFRSWEIPVDCLFGTMGCYSPSLPLTPDEIGAFGLSFKADLFTHPFITDKILDSVFGIHSQYVKENYVVRKAYNLFVLKSEYDTQAKVRNHFEGRNDENSLWIRDGLYRLISNVLFIEDPYRQGKYHPAFGANTKSVFEILSADEKSAFTRLYDNYFYERHNDYWAHLATKRLTAIFGDTRMLVCGEDLGMLPECVTSVLDSQRILSLEIQSMPKSQGLEFAHLDANPYRSVCTISTHDMPPLRLLWEENAARTQKFYHTMLQKEGKAPRQLPAHIAEEIIARHLYCPSMMCILTIQDWLAMNADLRDSNVYEERVNTPYDMYNQWKYRMNVEIEKLMIAEQYDKKLNTMIERSRR
jgi:4-alpha-glucanotransferase